MKKNLYAALIFSLLLLGGCFAGTQTVQEPPLLVDETPALDNESEGQWIAWPNSPKTYPNIPDPADKRILITPAIAAQQTTCMSFNGDAADTLVEYSNPEKGVAFKIPYNPKWGDEKYRINPYDEIESGVTWNPYDQTEPGITFGSIFTGLEGCGWIRWFYLGFEKTQPADAVLKELNDPKKYAYSAAGQGDVFRPIKKTINGLEVVEFQADDMCGPHGVIVIGKKYNYHFSAACYLDQGLNIFEQMVKTMEVL